MSCTECYMLYGKHQTHCPCYFPREETQIVLQPDNTIKRGFTHNIIMTRQPTEEMVRVGEKAYLDVDPREGIRAGVRNAYIAMQEVCKNKELENENISYSCLIFYSV